MRCLAAMSYGSGRRGAVVLVALALLMGGCASSDKEALPGPEVTEPDQPDFGYEANRNRGKGDASKGGSGAGEPGGGGTPGGPAPAPSAGGPAEKREPTGGPSDGEEVGTNAFWYLNARVPKLVVEIDAVSGAGPSDEAVELLVRRLKSVASKPGGIRVLPVENVASGRDSWTTASIRAFEQKNRDTRSSAGTAVVYIAYLDGESTDGALGIAYASSSFVVFSESMRANEFPTVRADDVEKSTIVHEMGHLLALVNLTDRSPREREDPQHRGHSSNIDSVMYWAVDNIGVFSTFRGLDRAPPNDFDADDRADLADLKTGKLKS